MKNNYVLYMNGFLGRRRWERIFICFIGMILCFAVMIGAHYWGESQVKKDREALEAVKPLLVSNCRNEYDVKTVLPEGIKLTAYEYYYADSVALVQLQSRFFHTKGMIKNGVEWRSGGDIELFGWEKEYPGTRTSLVAGICLLCLGGIIAFQFVLAGIARYKRKRSYSY